MNDALIAYGIELDEETTGFWTRATPTTMGIGAMSAERWAEFYQTVSDQGLYPKGLDVTKAYTLQFVNKKVGMDQKN